MTTRTRRQMRMEPTERKNDASKKGHLRLENGPLEGYESHAFVSGDTLTLKFCDANRSGLYVDDVLAMLRDMLLDHAAALKDTEIYSAANHVQQALETLDIRAAWRHGYSNNARERAYEPKQLRYPISKEK